MNKDLWASYIGHFIIAMNEIDWMTHSCRINALGKQVSKTWLRKTLAERLKLLCHDKKLNEALPELEAYLSSALVLCGFRNQIAHGSFIINCDKPMTNDTDSQIEIYATGGSSSISENDIRDKTRQCREISNCISKQLAIISMSKAAKFNSAKNA